MSTGSEVNTKIYTEELAEHRTFSKGRKWFSSNDDKAWAEKMYLIFIPGFFIYNAVIQQMGWLDTTTFWHVFQNVLMFLPYFLVPLFLLRNHAVPFYRQWWFKFQIYICVLTFFETYFHTEYFFEVLHMRYRFDEVNLYFDSMLLGPDQATALAEFKRIPVGMYFNTVAFFTCYHIAAIVVIRRLYNMTGGMSAQMRKVAFVAAVIFTAIFFAWAETYMYMTAAADGIVWYENLPRMLVVGSWFYALYFFVHFPNIYRMDEQETKAPWSIGRCILEASAASILVLLLLDLWVMYFGFDFIPLP